MNNLEDFCKQYEISEPEQILRLYELEELLLFLPANPTEEEKLAFQELLGAQSESGYLDYAKSNNTFELLMQWREKTGNL
ncbi:MAG: hypothetical protein NW226_21160 [Microscillaceae bacterium]|nr:hypothetical protein [Microscillaceae bacterium]